MRPKLRAILIAWLMLGLFLTVAWRQASANEEWCSGCAAVPAPVAAW